MKEKYNRLTTANTVALCNWLMANREEAEHKPRLQVAAKATEALGFPVSVSNLMGMHETIGYTTGEPRAEKKAPQPQGQVGPKGAAICRAILTLFAANRLQPPEEIKAWAEGLTT